MSDFLTRRLGKTVKLDLGDDYYVEIRALGKGEQAECQDKLTQMRMRYDERTEKALPEGEINASAYQEELVCRSIVSWNLDGPEGPLPTSPLSALRESYRRLPGSVADEIFQRCEELNAPPSKEETLRFPDGGVGSTEGSGSPAAAAGNGAVSDGARAVEAARATA